VLAGVKVAVIGPVTARTASKLGLTVDIQAEEFTIPGLVAALAKGLGPADGAE